ncbi:MAG: lactonase family protein, partial [Pirellulaceae bacterium]
MPTKIRVYVGTYTNGDSQGIYQFDLDLTTGKATAPTLAAEAKNPSFLAIHPGGKYLYSVSEVADFEGKKTGGVSAYSIAAESGALTLLNSTASGGRGPCHLVTDQAGKHVLVANYGEGSIACLPIKEDGSLADASAVVQHEGSSVNKQRQAGPHAHSINLDAANGFAFAADLGLDKVLVYGFDGEKGTLDAAAAADAELAPGSGPRHFAFHPGGKYAYVINEMLCTVTGFSYDAASGKLAEIQTLSTLPGDVEEGFSTAEIVAHPSGKFLYGSNRGHDSIVMYTIDEATGKLTYVGNESTQGKTPRNFAVDP